MLPHGERCQAAPAQSSSAQVRERTGDRRSDRWPCALGPGPSPPGPAAPRWAPGLVRLLGAVGARCTAAPFRHVCDSAPGDAPRDLKHRAVGAGCWSPDGPEAALLGACGGLVCVRVLPAPAHRAAAPREEQWLRCCSGLRPSPSAQNCGSLMSNWVVAFQGPPLRSVFPEGPCGIKFVAAQSGGCPDDDAVSANDCSICWCARCERIPALRAGIHDGRCALAHSR